MVLDQSEASELLMLNSGLFSILLCWSNGDPARWFKGSSESELQTQRLLFLESMSERVGSDMQRLWNWMMNIQNDWKSIEYDVIQIQSRSMLDPTLSDIDLNNKMASVLMNYP